MKSSNFTKTIVLIYLSFLIFSCQEDQELLEDSNPNTSIENTENETDLATFNFVNGNSFIIYKGYEEGEPYIATLESGTIDSRILIDIKNNSVLQIYLAFTPENTPIPQAIVDFSKPEEKEKLVTRRTIVDKLDDKIFTIDKYPSGFASPISDLKAGTFCDNQPLAHHCVNNAYESIRYNTPSKWANITMYTEVFYDSPGAVLAHLTVGRGKRIQKEHIIQPGHWARRSKFSIWMRRRGSYRFAPYNEHWRGYTQRL